MPLYKFECDRCGDQQTLQMTFEEHDFYRGAYPNGHAHQQVGACLTGIYKQVFDFHFNLGMREHYSDQLDMNVTSDRHFNNELKRQQDEYQARMGMDVRFETIDPNDAAAAQATDVGLEATERAHHDAASDGHKSIFT